MAWGQALALLATGYIAYAVVIAVKRIYFSPLSNIPGPKLAAATLWYEFYWDVIQPGLMMWRIQDMHRKYGPIVRINPYEVHIMDSDFFDELYVAGKKLDKYEWWVKLAGADGSSFATVTHEQHRVRRSALNPFFSARSVIQLEPMIKYKVEKLSSRFASIAETQEVVRLDVAFIALTMDIICDYAFANDRRYLDEPDFMLLWKQTVMGAFKSGPLARQLPWLLPLLKTLPIPVVFLLNPTVGYMFTWSAGAKKEVKRILEGKDELSMEGETSRTIFHTLRDSDLPPKEKELQRLCDEAEIITGAGSETTASTLSRICFYLRYFPETLAKLRAELDRLEPSSPELPSWSDLQGLPYLSAVIKEGLRLSYGVTTRLPRVSHEVFRYKDYVIPAGVPISETPYFILTDPAVFPEPDMFKPERWIEAEKQGNRLDRYLVSFGKGTRQCLGINLAYAELYLATYMVATKFDWELYQTSLDDVVCAHDFFVAGVNMKSKGVRATLSRRGRAS
ncbi:cytochrome P450 [Thozetella sp. PMI_491]|nr:cytochrome P450 [Thozetella sp. PMI_491]